LVGHVWRLLEPFHHAYARYIAGVVLRQSLLVAGGYGLVWALRLAMQHTGTPEWVFVAAFIAWDAGLLRLDIGLNTHFCSRLGFPLFGHLRSAALAKVLEMPLSWHYQQDTGQLIGKVNNGVGKVCQTAESIGRELAPALIRTGLSLIPLLWLSPMTAPAIVIALGVFMALTFAENAKRRRLREARTRNYNRDFGLFAEAVQYVKPVVQFGQTGRVLNKYGKVQQDIVTDGMAEIRIGNDFAWRRNFLLSVVKRGCQGVWIWQFRQGTLDAATVMYLNMVTEELLNSFWSYSSLLERIYESIEPTRLLVEILEEQPDIRDTSATKALPVPEQVAIEMQDIRFAYSRGNEVLKSFNLRVRPGTVVGVVGPSGGGKTTIHNLLSRMFDVRDGSILISGEEIRRWPLEQLRGMFSYVSQSDGVFLSEETLADTIRFARPEATFEEVAEAARCACIHDDIMRMPEQYKTIVGQRGLTLSKGQQQRIALAQALIALDERRKVLVLDEFTSALDSETERRILGNIRPHLAGRTAIIIAHRLSTIYEIADEIVVVDGGRIVECGSHSDLVRRGGWYAEMARLQAVA
jgi:ABC-type multidrug transport system fused ATPase/permease subunit